MENTKENPKKPVKEEPKENNKKDRWDKVAILLRPVGGLLTALMIAYIGFMSNGYLASRQQNEIRTRLYTELISQREESESALRKDMFTCIIGSFLNPDSATLEEKVLKLELLVYNFHESFNLKPLFIHITKQIDEDKDTKDSIKTEFKDRVSEAAREITAKQLAILANAGETWMVHIFLDTLNNEWLLNGHGLDDSLKVTGTTLEVGGIKRDFILRVDSVNMKTEEIRLELDISKKFKLDSIELVKAEIVMAAKDTMFKVTISERDGDFPDIGKEIKVVTANDTILYKVISVNKSKIYQRYPVDIDKKTGEECRAEKDENRAKFWVGFFDFPMIDNTRLSHDQRCAIVLNKFDTDTAEAWLTLVYFPGSHASLKEKPYYQEVVENLLVDKSNNK